MTVGILSFLSSIGTHHVRLNRGEEYTDFNFKIMSLPSVLRIDSSKIMGEVGIVLRAG